MQQINSAVAFAISQSPEGNHMKPLAIPLLFLTVSAGFSAFAAQQTNTGENKKMDSVVIPVTSESDRPVRIADPAHFTGKAIVAPLFPAEAPSEATAAYVTFEPGARTDWHSHPVGSIWR